MEDAMIMSGSDPAGLNDQRRVKGARLTTGTSFSLDVTEPEFSDGERSAVNFEVYMLVDTDCSVAVYYHSDTGMKLGKSQAFTGYSTHAAWKIISFGKSNVQFGSTEDIRVDVTGDSPMLAMVLVSSDDLPSRHIGNVVLSNEDNGNAVTKTWTISSLNSTNPPVGGSSATATGTFTAAGELGTSESVALTVSSVTDWSTSGAQAAIGNGTFGGYVDDRPDGNVQGYQGNLGVDSSPVRTDGQTSQIGAGLLEVLVYTIDSANLPSGDLYLTAINFQRYAGADHTDFVIFDVSENTIIEQQWNANFDGAGDTVNGSWELETGDKIIVGTGSENGENDFRVNDLTLDILPAAFIPDLYDL